MLHTIPFHITLLRKNLYDDIEATMSHILIYGAIQVHSFGALGCIASNTTIGKETGFSPATVSNVITQLKKAGWIYVELNENGHRKFIQPLLTLEKPAYTKDSEVIQDGEYPSFSPTVKEITHHSTVPIDNSPVSTGHSTVNIDNNINNIKDNTSSTTKVGKGKEVVLENDSKEINSLLMYFYSKILPTSRLVFSKANREALDRCITFSKTELLKKQPGVPPELSTGVKEVRDTIDKAEKILLEPYNNHLKVTSIAAFASKYKLLVEHKPGAKKTTTQTTKNF